jgi:RNA polymerase sigma-70 factor (ECF subfamily)
MTRLKTTSRPAPDAEVGLMLRVRRDDPAAFAALVDRYWTRVFGRFYRQLGHRQEAEDLAQEVFLRLYRSRKRYRPAAKLSTWVFHIAGNVARNAIRTRRRKPLLPVGHLAGRDECPGDVILSGRADPPSGRLERAEVADVVRGAVAALGRRQRSALELQFADRSYAEIAAALAMTPKAAKSLLYRARIQLRETLHPFVTAGD